MTRLFGDGGIGTPIDVSALEWSTSEQVWPFEKGINGESIYVKGVPFGNWPNKGTKSVSHGIVGYKALWNLVGAHSTTGKLPYVTMFTNNDTKWQSEYWVNSTSVVVRTGENLSSSYTTLMLIFYLKNE